MVRVTNLPYRAVFFYFHYIVENDLKKTCTLEIWGNLNFSNAILERKEVELRKKFGGKNESFIEIRPKMSFLAGEILGQGASYSKIEHFEGFSLKSTPKNVHFGNNPKFPKRYTLRKKNTVWTALRSTCKVE